MQVLRLKLPSHWLVYTPVYIPLMAPIKMDRQDCRLIVALSAAVITHTFTNAYKPAFL